METKRDQVECYHRILHRPCFTNTLILYTGLKAAPVPHSPQVAACQMPHAQGHSHQIVQLQVKKLAQLIAPTIDGQRNMMMSSKNYLDHNSRKAQ